MSTRVLSFAPLLLVAAAATFAVSTAASPRQAPDGKTLFETHCRKCHGPAGRPIAAMKKLLPELPTWDAAFFAKRTDADIVVVLTNGKGKNMKPFADRLTADEMLAVARYIRTLAP
ncbi:MAG: cytochrome c [Gemmatimonadetes bacterium]|nr:cytochrome c [Gemmatimonadota bacterium]